MTTPGLKQMPMEMSMNDDELLRSWAMKVLEREIIRSTPAARSRRAFQADQREIKREHAKRLRSLAAKSAAKTRELRKKLAADAQALKEKRAMLDAEFDRRRWNLLLRQGGSGVSSEEPKKKASR